MTDNEPNEQPDFYDAAPTRSVAHQEMLSRPRMPALSEPSPQPVNGCMMGAVYSRADWLCWFLRLSRAHLLLFMLLAAPLASAQVVTYDITVERAHDEPEKA